MTSFNQSILRAHLVAALAITAIACAIIFARPARADESHAEFWRAEAIRMASQAARPAKRTPPPNRHYIAPRAKASASASQGASAPLLNVARAYTGRRNFTGQRGPWCRHGLNHFIAKAGLPLADTSGRARDAVRLGKRVAQPRPGDIAVSRRHVTIFEGWADAHRFIGFGANQCGGRVCAARFSASSMRVASVETRAGEWAQIRLAAVLTPAPKEGDLVLFGRYGDSVAIKEASLGSSAFQLQGRFQKGVEVPLGGFSPNLFSPRNDINSFVLAAGADGMEMWLGDCLIAQEISSPAPTSRTIQHLQYGTNQTWPRNHELLALAYAPVKLTADERRQLLKHMEDELARDSKMLFRPRNHVHVDLDSITVGPSNNGWAQQMLADLSQPAYVLQNAIGGSTLALNPAFQLNLSNRLPAVLNGMPQTAETRVGRRFLSVLLPGANDIQPNYASAAAFLTALEAQVAQLRARGRIVIIIEPLHKGTAQPSYTTHNSRVDEIRTTLGGWVAAGKCDAVVVVSGNSNIGTFASTSNTTYWNADGIHLMAAGQTELKNLVAPVVNSFLLAV